MRPYNLGAVSSQREVYFAGLHCQRSSLYDRVPSSTHGVELASTGCGAMMRLLKRFAGAPSIWEGERTDNAGSIVGRR